MVKNGRKIYYCNITGEVIKILGETYNFRIETTLEQDYERFKELNEREFSSISLLELEYGVMYDEFSKCTGVMVDLETKELIFSYEELPQEPTEIEIIQEKISILEAENETLKQELSITQDAVNELIFNSLNI